MHKHQVVEQDGYQNSMKEALDTFQLHSQLTIQYCLVLCPTV